jgi:HTH-type transcriptional regulator/antitoxin HigA
MRRVKAISAKSLPADFHALVRILPPATIRDQVDYDNVQELIDALTSLPKLTDGQEHYLDTLAVLMHAHEEEVEPMPNVSPVEMLKFLMEQNEMNASDLGRLLGERSLGPKVLNGDRELSKAHIRKLAERFAVSPALFL